MNEGKGEELFNLRPFKLKTKKLRIDLARNSLSSEYAAPSPSPPVLLLAPRRATLPARERARARHARRPGTPDSSSLPALRPAPNRAHNQCSAACLLTYGHADGTFWREGAVLVAVDSAGGWWCPGACSALGRPVRQAWEVQEASVAGTLASGKVCNGYASS